MKYFRHLLLLLTFLPAVYFGNINTAQAFCCAPCLKPECIRLVADCSTQGCECQSNDETEVTVPFITDKFIEHREWLIKTVWEAHMLPAMMLMTEQMTSTAVQQAMMIGTLFDAKHQLESQRMLQTLEAEAHAAYHPSEGMCQFGTMTRSLAKTERKKDISQFALAARFSQRQRLNGDGISGGGPPDDLRSRFTQYKNLYCDPRDMGGNIEELCTPIDLTRANKDINFSNIAMKNNLSIDFRDPISSFDETDILALQANLYGHTIMPSIPQNYLASEDGTLRLKGAQVYMKMRALLAKRSIAEASFAAYVAARTESDASMQPYMEAVLTEMGITPEDAQIIFGIRPSYHTQMYFLTNTMYQDPKFYADLYDKPENVDRKKVSMQAINLKLRGDMYDTHLRSNANQAVLLETMIDKYEEKFVNEANRMRTTSDLLTLPEID